MTTDAGTASIRPPWQSGTDDGFDIMVERRTFSGALNPASYAVSIPS